MGNGRCMIRLGIKNVQVPPVILLCAYVVV